MKNSKGHVIKFVITIKEKDVVFFCEYVDVEISEPFYQLKMMGIELYQ